MISIMKINKLQAGTFHPRVVKLPKMIKLEMKKILLVTQQIIIFEKLKISMKMFICLGKRRPMPLEEDYLELRLSSATA